MNTPDDFPIPDDVSAIFAEADESGVLGALFTKNNTVQLVNSRTGEILRESAPWANANEYARRILSAALKDSSSI